MKVAVLKGCRVQPAVLLQVLRVLVTRGPYHGAILLPLRFLIVAVHEGFIAIRIIS